MLQFKALAKTSCLIHNTTNYLKASLNGNNDIKINKNFRQNLFKNIFITQTVKQ